MAPHTGFTPTFQDRVVASRKPNKVSWPRLSAAIELYQFRVLLQRRKFESRKHYLEIDANHSDGDTLKMYFGQVGSGINELSEVQRPDGGTLQYLYDASGNLVEVDKPEKFPPGPFPIAARRSRRVTHPRPYAYVSGSELNARSLWAAMYDGHVEST